MRYKSGLAVIIKPPLKTPIRKNNRFDIQNNRKWTKKRIFVNKQSNVYRTDYMCKNNFKRQDLPIVKIHLKFDNPYQSKLS